jgi:hypothetical protein
MLELSAMNFKTPTNKQILILLKQIKNPRWGVMERAGGRGEK